MRTSNDQWRRARHVFDAVVDLEPDARAAALDAACAGDVDLRREVEALLAFDRSTGDGLERIVARAAAEAAHEADASAVQSTPVPSPAFLKRVARYRIVARLGEGGMGVVYEAEDSTLGRRIAIKRPLAHLATDPVTRQRLHREARAAATLNHPHVCVVHEIAEDAAGHPFIAMELIDGETLTTRIRRGPLPISDVLTLGRQATSALTAAHALGVVHRDLKPSNIMFTRHGLKLLDFGLASVSHDAILSGATAVGMAGTVPYMSPEQVRGEALDLRTDVFSLGAVLYEAATGQLPFAGASRREMCTAICESEPVPPSRLNPGIPPALERVILRALAKPLEDRYQTAQDVAADLAAIDRRASVRPAGRTTPSRRVGAPALLQRRGHGLWTALVLAGAVSGLVAAVAPTSGGSSAGGLTGLRSPVASLLLGDISNSTGESDFDGTLEQALEEQLQQAPWIRLLPREGVREALRQMNRPTDAGLSSDVANEVARRRGLDASVAGTIERHENGYRVTLVARGPTGAVLARSEEGARNRDDVLRALDAAATHLAVRLGDGAGSNAVPRQATTRSLDALRAFTLGSQSADRGDYATALGFFERAVLLDPDFAMAYRALARHRVNTLQPRQQVVDAAARAFALRDRTTEQERRSIEVTHFALALRRLDRAIALAEEWKAAYPSEFRPHHALGDLYMAIGRHNLAAVNAREAVRLLPDVAAAHSQLGASLFVLGRLTEAHDVYRQALSRGLDAAEYHASLWQIAYYLDDADEMRRQVAWAAASSSWAHNLPALIAGLQGRWRDARSATRQSSAFFAGRAMPGMVSFAARYEAVNGALVGDCATTRRAAARTAGFDPGDAEARVMVALALCGHTTQAQAWLSRVRRTHDDESRASVTWLPLIDGALALERGRPGQALEALRSVPPHEYVLEGWPIYLRALASLQAGDTADAVRGFETLADNPWRSLWTPLGPLSRLGAARARARAGNLAGARAAYDRFFATWKDADTDLPVLVEARAEYAALR